jgi:RHS repeat-associated protein
VRQKFTAKERDDETGLDYFGARYLSSVQGRFVSPDPLEFWMLDEKKQPEYIANPQRWNKYAYVLNNPLRYVDPTGLAEVPVWEKLDKTLREDLTKRGVTKADWNKWNNDQRQEVLNNRAILMEAGVWGNVTSITFGTFTVVDNWGTANDKTNFTPSTSGWALAITTDKDIQADLVKAGFKYESNVWNHPEGKWTLKQGGDDFILHVVGLKGPSDKYMVNHFDSGGGSIFNKKHFSDWWNNKGVTQDAVTRSLGGTPAASHLKGISPDIDKLLTQGKKNK